MSTTTPETPQPQQPPPQGALSGALSSLVAVGHYASRTCAAARYDFTTLFRRDALPVQRVKAAGGLALTAIIVAVLGYAAFQEWRIHIAYNPELAHQQLLKAEADVTKARAETCSARMQAIIDTVPQNQLAEATDTLQRECNPTYAAHAKVCDEKFAALLYDFDHINKNDSNATLQLLNIVARHDAAERECGTRQADRQAWAARAK
jgi:hypothetical protein